VEKGNKYFVIVGKKPEEGFSKTRLAKDLNGEGSESLYDSFIKDFFYNYSKRADLKSIFGKLLLFVTPISEDSKKYFESILKSNLIDNFEINYQSNQSFFFRLKDIFERVNEENEGSFIHLTGTDIPDFPFRYIEGHFDKGINKEDVFIGPDEDGGFYYIGTAAKNSQIFEFEHNLSNESVIGRVINRCRELNLRVRVLEKWSDIDNLEDLKSCLCRSPEKIIPHTYKNSKKLGII